MRDRARISSGGCSSVCLYVFIFSAAGGAVRTYRLLTTLWRLCFCLRQITKRSGPKIKAENPFRRHLETQGIPKSCFRTHKENREIFQKCDLLHNNSYGPHNINLADNIFVVDARNLENSPKSTSLAPNR